MPNIEALGTQEVDTSHRGIREDPRYEELKKIIDEFPQEKIDRLKSYIQKWLKSR